VNNLVKKWTIRAVTLALLSTGGYKVVTFDDDRGYGVVDTVLVRDTITVSDTTVHIVEKKDTVWFRDSVKLVEFARIGSSGLGEGVLK
jgi:hypothetical protein